MPFKTVYHNFFKKHFWYNQSLHTQKLRTWSHESKFSTLYLPPRLIFLCSHRFCLFRGMKSYTESNWMVDVSFEPDPLINQTNGLSWSGSIYGSSASTQLNSNIPYNKVNMYKDKSQIINKNHLKVGPLASQIFEQLNSKQVSNHTLIKPTR